MSISEELQRLSELHRSGAITEAEYQQAKAAVLARHAPPASESDPTLKARIDDLARDNEVARIDREWEAERLQYAVRLFGHIPTCGQALLRGGVFVAFGVLMLIGVHARAKEVAGVYLQPEPNLFATCCPWIAIFTGVAAAGYLYWKAVGHASARRAYRERRARALGLDPDSEEFLNDPDRSP